jgi:hypothetical protein
VGSKRTVKSVAREVGKSIADNLSKTGWSSGYVAALGSQGRMIWIAETPAGLSRLFAASADRRFKFNKRAELFVCTHDETLPVVPSKKE